MLGLTSLEVYISIFNKTEEIIKFELYSNTFDDFSFAELIDKLEEILSFSGITPSHLQHEKIGPRLIQAYNKLGSEKSSTDGFIMLVMGYGRSLFRDFESYLRIVVDLDENDIQLILKHYNSNFVIYQTTPGIHSIKHIAEAVHTRADHEDQPYNLNMIIFA